MRLHKDEVFHLRDAKKHLLGTVTIKGFIGDRVQGDFIPEADFSLYRDLFLEHEEAVNDLLMARVEDLEQEIAALDLSLTSLDKQMTQGIYSVQIMEGDSISFKVRLGYREIVDVCKRHKAVGQ